MAALYAPSLIMRISSVKLNSGEITKKSNIREKVEEMAMFSLKMRRFWNGGMKMIFKYLKDSHMEEGFPTFFTTPEDNT